ncbi:MAG: type 1 glutamine amidotransferase [Alteromonadaceae bacterium]|nr:type 1 glutamine amidotransferase [Alteromonadaceae bacterium]
MAKEVLIFLHSADDAPGYLVEYFQQRKIPHRVIDSYKNEIIPALNDSIAGLAFMGGSMSANDDIAWLKDELKLIEQALEAGRPILGHCLGGQLISKALGQKISKNAVPELGWHYCFRDKKTKCINTDDDWLGDIQDPFIMFHWHYETFSIPPTATPLFSSEHCKNQAYRYGDNVLAMQCHVEMTESMLTCWVNNYPDELQNESSSEQTPEQITKNIVENVSALNRVAEQLYGKWVNTLVF